jgi:hypothetical protein
MNIDELTPEQLETLEAQIEARKQAESDRIRRERETYRDIVGKTV